MQPQQELIEINTPGIKTVAQLAKFLGKDANTLVKTLVVRGKKCPWIVVLIRGDHKLNLVKAGKHPMIASQVEFADEQHILKIFGCSAGFLGPVGCNLPIVADYAVQPMCNMTVGGNRDHTHLGGVNWQRDIAEGVFADLRNIEEGERTPFSKGNSKGNSKGKSSSKKA